MAKCPDCFNGIVAVANFCWHCRTGFSGHPRIYKSLTVADEQPCACGFLLKHGHQKYCPMCGRELFWRCFRPDLCLEEQLRALNVRTNPGGF